MTEQIIVSGFGGQGIMRLGKNLITAAMEEGKNVCFYPSYGPEMRGGDANCNVIVSDELIGSPIVTEADTVIAMNYPAFLKYEKSVVPGGKLLVNSSIVPVKSTRTDIDVYYVPANEIADEAGSQKIVNMIMLAAYIELTGAVSPETVMQLIREQYGERKPQMVAVNEKAMKLGAEAVR